MERLDIRGPECPLTGRTVADELQHAVAMLQSEKVGERDGVRYNYDEYRAYCDGWYYGISRALAVMITALERRELRLRTRDPESPRRVFDHHGIHDERVHDEVTRPAAGAQSPGGAGKHAPGRARRPPRDEQRGGTRRADVRAGRSSR